MSREGLTKDALIVMTYAAITAVGCGVDWFFEGHLSKGFASFMVFIWGLLFVTRLFDRLDAILDHAEQIREEIGKLKAEIKR